MKKQYCGSLLAHLSCRWAGEAPDGYILCNAPKLTHLDCPYKDVVIELQEDFKMKTKEIIVTESGTLLINPNDGFVIYGALLKGDNTGGLLGDGKTIQQIQDANINPKAYTNFEFIDALNLPLNVLQEYIWDRTNPLKNKD